MSKASFIMKLFSKAERSQRKTQRGGNILNDAAGHFITAESRVKSVLSFKTALVNAGRVTLRSRAGLFFDKQRTYTVCLTPWGGTNFQFCLGK